MPITIEEVELFGEEETVVSWSTLGEENLLCDLMALWAKSTVTEAKLQAMVEEGTLPPRNWLGGEPLSERASPHQIHVRSLSSFAISAMGSPS